MQLPLADTTYFVGFIALFALFISTFSKYRQTKNQASLLIALASFFLSWSLFFSGVPTLFTSDPQILEYFSLGAEVFQLAMLLTIWILVIRSFAANNRTVRAISYTFVVALFLACLVESAIRNTTPPYDTVTIIQLSNVAYDIVFSEGAMYRLLLGINYISLILLGVYFWRSADLSPQRSQRLRLKCLAAAFILGAAGYAYTPGYPWQTYFDLKDIGLTFVYLLIGTSVLIGGITKIRDGEASTTK